VQLILSIPMLIAVVFTVAAAVLRICGIEIHWQDPLVAGVIAAVAGMLGAAPLVRQTDDALAAVKTALAGTVLHLLACAVLTIVAIGLHLEDGRGQFLIWILVGYWISIFSLVWLARRILIAKALEAQH
jgi:hypothetical protein